VTCPEPLCMGGLMSKVVQKRFRYMRSFMLRFSGGTPSGDLDYVRKRLALDRSPGYLTLLDKVSNHDLFDNLGAVA